MIILLFLVSGLVFTTLAYTSGLLSGSNPLSSSGIVANVNLGVYSNLGCTQNVSSISWGTCYPGNSYTSVVYIKNLGTVDTTLTIIATGWNPTSSSGKLTFSTDYTAGRAIAPGSSLKVTLTLAVSSLISEISSFGFNIVINSQG